MLIFTIGHSTRPIEQLIAVLKHYKIEQLVDIRHFPQSRHNPQFNKDFLKEELGKNNIDYVWLEKLGGFRESGYVEYMQTDDFADGIKELDILAKQKKIAYMCAELLFFRCHRRYVSDIMKEKGWRVIHIFDETRTQEHEKRENKIKCD